MIAYLRLLASILRPSAPIPVWCATCQHGRTRIGWDEAHTLLMQAERGKRRRIHCRTRGCLGYSVPAAIDDLAAEVTL